MSIVGRAPRGPEDPDAFSVAFGDVAIVVRSRIPEARDWIVRHYRHMLRPRAGEALAELEVTTTADGFVLLGDGERRAEARSLGSILGWLDREVAGAFQRSRSDLVWIHAAGGAREEGAVLFAGPSGAGKSTLIRDLCTRSGWTFLGDDLAPVDPERRRVLPYPRSATVRRADGRAGMKEEVTLDASVVAEHPVSLVAVLFEHRPGPPNFARCSPSASALDLLGTCMRLDDGGLRRFAFESVCALARAIPVHRFGFPDSDSAARILDEVPLDRS